MATTLQSKTETYTIHIPNIDIQRFKGLAKAMGWTFEKNGYYESPQFYADLDEAEKEIAEGNGVKISGVEEINNLFL